MANISGRETARTSWMPLRPTDGNPQLFRGKVTLDELYELCRDGGSQLALVRLLERLDADLRAERFVDVSALLARLLVDQLSPNVLVGAAAITRFAHEQLGATRSNFVARVTEHLRNVLGEDRANALMQSRR
jgi:hypothetical protein